jgi:hypothetical protein
VGVRERLEENALVVDPARTYGALALLLSRATARYVAERWDEERLEPDAKLPRLAGRLGPVLLHTPSLVQHVGGRSVWGGKFLQAVDFAPRWKAGSGSGRLAGGPLTAETARAALEDEMTRLPPVPADLDGAGVVIPAGGLRYLVGAWVTIRLLRHLGCRLPVEIWHLGPEEMPEAFARFFQTKGIDCVDAHARLAAHPARQIRSFALKPFAVMASRFRHVILLDADNVPVMDPTFLLDTPEYGRTGAIFWPDRAELSGIPRALITATHPVWAVSGLEFRGDPSFESGQVVIDKLRCWRELALTSWMNEHADFWHRIVHGDKDTFQVAWRKLGTPWAMPGGPEVRDRRAFWQLDFDGRVVFQHRHGDKWRLDGGNPAIPDFAHEALCREAAAELKEALLPELNVGAGAGAPPLEATRWLWRRPGRDARILTLRPGGFVDAGRERDACLWRATGRELELLGDDLSVTDRLRAAPALNLWRGRGTPASSLLRLESGSGGLP